MPPETKTKNLGKSTNDDDGTREGTIVGNRRLASGQAANLFSHPSSSYFSTPQRQWTDLYPFIGHPWEGHGYANSSSHQQFCKYLTKWFTWYCNLFIILLNSVQTIFIGIHTYVCMGWAVVYLPFRQSSSPPPFDSRPTRVIYLTSVFLWK